MIQCLTLSWQVMRKTKKSLNLSKVLLMKSASLNLNTSHQIPTPRLWLKSKSSASKMSRKLLIQTTNLFVTRLFFLSMPLFTKNSTSSLRATRQRLTRLCILFKNMLFAHGLRTSISVLTAEALMKSVRLTQRLTSLQEHTAQDFSQEDKHRFFLLQHSVL